MAPKKLLVADDSLTIQKVIRLALSSAQASAGSKEGYEIQAVSDGNDAIQQISLFRPDAVLIDVSLPGKNAFEVKRAINEHPDLEEVRFILMSSAFEKVDEPQVDQVAFHGRLTKPFDPAHLRGVLQEVLEKVAARKTEKTTLLNRPAHPAPSGTAPVAPKSSAPVPPKPVAPSKPQQTSAPVQAEVESFMPVLEAKPTLGEIQEKVQAQAAAQTQSYSPPVSIELNHDLNHDDLDLTLSPVGPDDTQPLELGDLGSESGTHSGIISLDSKFDDLSIPIKAGAPDSDIKELTESTIRLSGLDDFQWSVEEKAKKDEGTGSMQLNRESGQGRSEMSSLAQSSPTLPPLPGFEDLSGVAFSLDTSPLHSSASSNAGGSDNWSSVEPPFEPNRAEAREFQDFANSQSITAGPDLGSVTLDLPGSLGIGPDLNSGQQQSSGAQVVSLSEAQVEEVLRKQIEQTFTKLAERILPEIAEKVIRQEIHRMLEEGSKER